MDYFKINYNKLQNIEEVKLFKLVIIIIILGIIFLIWASKVSIYRTQNISGIYENDTLWVSTSYDIVDSIKNGEYLLFNDNKSTYEILSISEYYVTNGNVYQDIELKLDAKFINNEVGIVEFHYDKSNLLNYILELFK